MAPEHYRTMLDDLQPFHRQATLVDARETFGVDSPTKGRNDKRRESLVETGVYPSELLAEVLTKADLKSIVDRYSLDAHKRRSDEMIDAIIEYFEITQHYTESRDDIGELYLTCFEDIADGQIDRIPPQLQSSIEDADATSKLEVLFERGTAEIFDEVFNLAGTTLLGQHAGGNVADGEIEQDGKWLLWDNKRRVNEFKLGSSTRAKIKDYIDTKNQQHDVEWFLIIAPGFAPDAGSRAIQLEKQVGVDIRLVSAAVFREMATLWLNRFDTDGRELPLSIFTGAEELSIEEAEEMLDTQFA